MNTIRTTIKNRHIDIPAPAELPDGTEIIVDIHIADQKEWLDESDWDDSSTGNQSWIEWATSLKPMEFTSAEKKLIDDNMQDDKAFEIMNFNNHSDSIRNLFE